MEININRGIASGPTCSLFPPWYPWKNYWWYPLPSSIKPYWWYPLPSSINPFIGAVVMYVPCFLLGVFCWNHWQHPVALLPLLWKIEKCSSPTLKSAVVLHIPYSELFPPWNPQAYHCRSLSVLQKLTFISLASISSQRCLQVFSWPMVMSLWWWGKRLLSPNAAIIDIDDVTKNWFGCHTFFPVLWMIVLFEIQFELIPFKL